MATTGTGPVPGRPKDDKQLLMWVLIAFGDVPEDDVEYEDHPIVRALNAAGITRFAGHLITLSEDDIKELRVPGERGSPDVPLSFVHRRTLTIIIAFYHYACLQAKGPVKIYKIGRTTFDDYRVSVYDPNVSTVPWKKALTRRPSPN